MILNLRQITDKLNLEFASDQRKLIFWYDADAEFISDIDDMELENAKILRLERDNQFYIKYFLEREDVKTSYLIYAPFPKPGIRDNHLADTILYSKEFFADRASLLSVDLGIEEQYRHVIQKHIKFFGAKDRTQRFYDLEIERYDQAVIETAMMSVLCRTKTVSFEEIARTLLSDGDIENSRFISEFEKYDLADSFWNMCEQSFGYRDESPSLRGLVYTLFTTYASRMAGAELPQSWKNYCSHKSGSIIAFLDSMMNSVIYSERFDELSDMVYSDLNGEAVFDALGAQDLAELEIFRKADVYIIRWLIQRLEHEDKDAKLSGYSVRDLCRMRRKMHFGSVYYSHYYIIENAAELIKAGTFTPQKTAQDIWKSYIEEDYVFDQKYRYFYYHYDMVESNAPFENLRDLVENIYTNRFLNPLCVAWSSAFAESGADTGLDLQRNFYSRFVKNAKERVIVIISDALRYEVGQTLLKRLMADEKCSASMNVVQSVVPSYTRFGMSALLPHRELSMSEDFRVMADGLICDDLKSREQLLRSYCSASRAVQFDDIKSMKVSELKEIFTGQEVVYVYHNQIDARGDKLNTENEVFRACEEAVEEIHVMIKRLTSANNVRFIVTADHGFLYKRDRLSESDKISGFDRENCFAGRRFAVSDEKLDAEAAAGISLGKILGNDDRRVVSVPVGSDVFKVSGGGQNFVHGGASLQEIIVPVIDIKTSKYHTETRSAGISLIGSLSKITNLTTNLDFIQTEAVSDVNKETTYKIFFISGDNEKISNDNIYVADRKSDDASSRIFRLRFSFKNMKYDANRKYYLVAYDEKNALEVIRQEVKMDILFADDFGFNV